jgi:hypothetical protein
MKEFLRPTWHVYDDCVLKVFERHREIMALKMAADLIASARRMQAGR